MNAEGHRRPSRPYLELDPTDDPCWLGAADLRKSTINQSKTHLPMKLRSSIWLAAAVVTVVWSLSLATAAEKSAIDPAGTWKIATINSETKAKNPERTLKLKMEGGKLAGTIDGRSEINGKVKLFEWPIKDTKLKGNDISFTVTHAPTAGNGPDSTTVYEGKITGDTIKGTAATEWNGNSMKRDFEARRVTSTSSQ